MAIALIDKWLQNPEIKTGIEIYAKFISKKSRLTFYKSGALDLDDLIEELTDFSNSNIESEKKTYNSKTEYPPQIKELDNIASKAWKERTYLRAIIINEPNEQVRKEMAFKILDNAELAFNYWNKIKHWEETGELPLAEKHTKDDLLTLIEKLKNIPTYLSKIDKKLKDKPNVKREAELIEQRAKHNNDYKAANDRLLFLNDKIKELCL